MSTVPAGTSRLPVADMVPLADRLRYLRVFRLTTVAAVLAFALVMPETLRTRPVVFAAGTVGYLAAALLAEGAWRLLSRRAITLFGVLLIGDALFIAWACLVSGGIGSPLRYLVVLHAVAVVLLASYRTGLKLVLWHSLLLVTVYYVLVHTGDRAIKAASAPGMSPYQHLVVFVSAVWCVAIATAVFSAVNERELRRRRFDLEALAHMATELESSNDPGVIADILVTSVGEVFDVERVVLLGGAKAEMGVLACRGQVVVSAPDIGPGSVARLAADSRRSVRTASLDVVADAWLHTLMPGARNLIAVPLSAEGRAIGVLLVEHGTRAGSRVERRVVTMLERFASQGALALRSAWLLEQVREAASIDSLTGVFNRRVFDTVLDRELPAAADAGASLSLVMIDVDHFKSVNDTYGHQVGDRSLQAIAALVQEQCRQIDTPARYGGEEFVVILPGVDSSGAAAFGDAVRRAVARYDEVVPLTVSVGVATFPTQAAGREELVRAADDALYLSKQRGRDQVTMAGEFDEARVPAQGATSTGAAVVS